MAYCGRRFHATRMRSKPVRPPRQELLSALAETQLFHDLDEKSIQLLSERLVARAFPKGQIIFHQGDPGDALFVLVDGLVKVTVTSPKGDQMLLITLDAPATFGELALIDGQPRSASVEAVERTEVLILGRDVWSQLVDDQPSFTEALLSSMARMVRRLTDQASDFAFLDLHGRVAKLLVRYADEGGQVTPGGVMLDLHLTQSDIARMVGGSRQSVNQILRSLEERGYLEIQNRKILLVEPDRLRQRALL